MAASPIGYERSLRLGLETQVRNDYKSHCSSAITPTALPDSCKALRPGGDENAAFINVEDQAAVSGLHVDLHRRSIFGFSEC